MGNLQAVLVHLFLVGSLKVMILMIIKMYTLHVVIIIIFNYGIKTVIKNIHKLS